MRVLGLELGGGKSSRTALVVLEHYPDEKKIFVTKIFSHLTSTKTEPSDVVLIDKMKRQDASIVGVNAPLGLPPCFKDCEKTCKGILDCRRQDVAWMNSEAKSAKIPVQKFPTPYTQRPIDVYLKTRVQPRIKLDLHLEETLGASKAPLLARVAFLRRYFPQTEFMEVHPRLALLGIADWFSIPERYLRRYKDIEDGAAYRMSILEYLENAPVDKSIPNLFLYEADKINLAKDLSAFQALFCALMPIYNQLSLLEPPGADFSKQWDFVAIPKEI